MKQRTVALMAILAAACCALAAQNYTFQTVLECNNLTVFPYAVNGLGVVVGIAYDNISGSGAGMTYFNGKCQTYPSDAFYGVTDNDWLIGGVENSKTYELIEPGAKVKVIPLPNYPGLQPGDFSYCCMNKSSGVLAGNYWPGPAGIISGFFYKNGKFTSLPWNESYWFQIAALNKTGIVVGTYEGNYLQGFIYRKEKMTLLHYPGAKYTYFQGLNDDGIVVGFYVSGDNEFGIFLFNIETDTWTKLNLPSPYDGMTPVGISNTGVIALQYSPSGGMVIATPN